MTYLYSASSAARILGKQPKEIKAIAIWANVIWVHVKGSRPRFVSKRFFKEHFTLWRKVNGQRLRASGAVHMEAHGAFTVSSQRKQGSFHSVTLNFGEDDTFTKSQPSLTCSCGDFKRQIESFGKGCCKHGYAVLQTLGYGSLEDFVRNHR